MACIRRRGRLAALIAFIYTVLVSALMVLWPSSRHWPWIEALSVLVIPLAITLVGTLAGYWPRGLTVVRWIVAVLMLLYVTVGITLLGLFFIPAAIASVIAAIQSRPDGGRPLHEVAIEPNLRPNADLGK